MNNSFIPLANALGWALIHSLWQAGIIFLVVHLLLKLFRQAPARAQYLLAMSALAGIFICFIVTFYYQWLGQRNAYVTQVSIAGLLPLASPEAHVAGATSIYHVRDLFQPGLLIPYFVVLYVLGLIFCMGKVIRDIFMIQRIRHTRISSFDEAWKHYTERLSHLWNISRKVGLFVSGYIDVPIVIGYFKPVIYLPFSVANDLPPDQIEAILLHELAHVKRNDFLLNILQTLVDTILFFNPFVYWLSKTIRTERENCCDELVTSVVKPKEYAHALLTLSERLRMKRGRFVLGAAAEKQQLFKRIKRIMEMKTKKLNYVQKLLALLILLGSIASVSWLAPGKKAYKQQERIQKNKPALLMPVTSRDSILPKALPTPPTPVNNKAKVRLPPSLPDTLPVSGKHAILNKNATGSLSFPKWHYQSFQDSSLRDMQQKLQQYAQKMQQYAQKMQQEINNSDEWKKYRQDIQAYNQKLKDYFNSTEWKKQQEKIREEAAKIRQHFNSSEWRQRMDSIQQQVQRAMINRDSLLARVNEQIASVHPNNTSTTVLSSNGHVIRLKQITRELMEDDLLNNDKNYTVRINDQGLYINGKKQASQYFEKYHHIIGDHTNLKIENKHGQIQYTISSKDISGTIQPAEK